MYAGSSITSSGARPLTMTSVVSRSAVYASFRLTSSNAMSFNFVGAFRSTKRATKTIVLPPAALALTLASLSSPPLSSLRMHCDRELSMGLCVCGLSLMPGLISQAYLAAPPPA